METKKQSEGTKPIDNFGTAPVPNPSVRQTNYGGTLLKDRYLIEGELGRGGIGVVYLARDQQLMQRRVVIKVLLESSENSLHTPWFRKKFDQEIEALVRIDHPGVVGVLDVGAMPDGKPFFVMQFVEGVTLRSLLQKEAQPAKFDLARAAHIVRQIGVALTAAHDKGIVHRDLKPENVMAQIPQDGEEVIKLIDFGIATVKDSQSNNTDAGKTKVAGALPYMAPEQLRGEPQAASDTWSLGVMAYEMLTGQLPFSAETLIHLHEQQLQGTFPRPCQLRADLPPAAEQVILKALSYAPEARYARARDFGDALSEALLTAVPRATQTNAPASWQVSPSAPTLAASEAEVKAITDTVNAPVRRPAPGRSPLPYFALVVVLLAGVAGVYSYWKLRNAAPSHLPQTPPVVAALSPERILSYSIGVCLSVKPDYTCAKAAKEYPGEIFFPASSGLRLNLTSNREGYFYIFNEDPQLHQGLPVYNLLVPAPESPEAKMPEAKMSAGRSLRLPNDTAFFAADKTQGEEKLWLIWSPQPVNELEQVRADLAARHTIEVKDPKDVKQVQEYLARNYPTAKAVAEKDETQTHLKGKPDGLLIYQLKLQRQ
jgi:serine/threonine protein kinase